MRIDLSRTLVSGDMDGDWAKDVDTVSDALSDIQNQLMLVVNGGLTTEENTTSSSMELTLDHNTPVRVKNPLDVPCKGIWATKCIGLTVGTDNKTTRAVYSLGLPQIEWHAADTSGSTLLITPKFPLTVSGAIGQQTGPITRVFSNDLGLTTNTVANVCTTPSITLTAGEHLLSSAVSFEPGATTSWTLMEAGVSATSAALPAGDTIAVPTAGEIRIPIAQAAAVPGNNFIAIPLPSYRVSVASGATKILYLVARAIFTVSTMKVFGWMEASRVVEAYSVTAPRGRVRLFFYGG